MTRQEKQRKNIRKNLEKVKNADIKPWRLLVSGYAVFNLDKTEKLFNYLLEKTIDGFIFVESLGRPRPKKENQGHMDS